MCTAAALIARDRVVVWLLPALASTPIAAIFMYSFAQVWHLNTGGTFGMHRYAVWFIPLTIPVFAEAQAACGARFDRWLAPVAIIACIWSVGVAHPRYPEQFLEPTWFAEWVWTTHPSFSNPFWTSSPTGSFIARSARHTSRRPLVLREDPAGRR